MRFFWYVHVRSFQEHFPEASLRNDVYVATTSWLAAAALVAYLNTQSVWLTPALVAAFVVSAVLVVRSRIKNDWRPINDPHYPGFDRGAFVLSIALLPTIFAIILACPGLAPWVMPFALFFGSVFGLLFHLMSTPVTEIVLGIYRSR